MSEKTGTPERAEKNKPNRPDRVPFGTRNVLIYPKREGYHRHVFNDEDGRVAQAEAAGYVVVREDLEPGDPKAGAPKQIGSAVNPSVGGGQKGVLMEIKEEYYKEDQKAKIDKLKVIENDMRRSPNDRRAGEYGKIEIS